jgi:hypothetical protein
MRKSNNTQVAASLCYRDLVPNKVASQVHIKVSRQLQNIIVIALRFAVQDEKNEQ